MFGFASHCLENRENLLALIATASPPDMRYRLENQETELDKRSYSGLKTLPDLSTPKEI